MERVGVSIQELSFLEFAEPSLEQGFMRCVRQGAAAINVVPLFLLPAGHIKQDIPRILDSLQLRYPQIKVEINDPFGVQSQLLDAIAKLVRSLAGEVSATDQVVIIGRGSSDPVVQEDFSRLARSLQTRLGTIRVTVCYLAAARPSLHDGLESVVSVVKHGNGGKIIVVPYLLFSGLLLAEVERNVRERRKQGLTVIQTGPLHFHRVIEDIVVNRAIR